MHLISPDTSAACFAVGVAAGGDSTLPMVTLRSGSAAHPRNRNACMSKMPVPARQWRLCNHALLRALLALLLSSPAWAGETCEEGLRNRVD